MFPLKTCSGDLTGRFIPCAYRECLTIAMGNISRPRDLIAKGGCQIVLHRFSEFPALPAWMLRRNFIKMIFILNLALAPAISGIFARSNLPRQLNQPSLRVLFFPWVGAG